MSAVEVFDDRTCLLGEGPLWHPEREQLFWFDIEGKKLLSRFGDQPLEWQFDECFSTAGWIDRETLLLASETGLWRFDIVTGTKERLVDLEGDIPANRSNDGRADPHGGFWIGTMGKRAEAAAGAIYRILDGELTRLSQGLSIPNSICFSPDGRRAYFADTPTGKIMALTLDRKGWPKGEPEIFVDLSREGLKPDGSVVDSDGAIWNAQWGASRIARYLPDGTPDRAIELPVVNPSCPAFGGAAFGTLFVTTAHATREADRQPGEVQDGETLSVATGIRGCAEPRVKI
ncbi:SMP-30/gluconolactonase/LRE family protein [Notoacmeibacter sp. MSK16QG-6]|uniref:SMP-30/gluconolactonase/LRE family protein n=1 Tax=Notoacmeibacter sp. MSK16QG-6 TaxID=2957982 RepID=UPI00209FDF64|nr:SMP-30/gluconolactonase/LRE family protein [Notoacmeibacter sp. MSK16QG-6]MCP1201055.1 SMP-30/gluconolactonase/LRE family protein [Notoacmeibacter sp. MSK16QG-6]